MQDYPTKHSGNSTEIDPKSFAQALQEIYEDPEGTIYVEYEKIKDVPLFTLPELNHVLGKMRNRRGADKSNVVVEMK